MLLGGTGTAGSAAARGLIDQGHKVIAVVRAPSLSLPSEVDQRVGDLSAIEELVSPELEGTSIDAIVSCLASRTGLPADAWAVDCDAHLRVLELAKKHDVRRFIYLSAICVQKPKLAFQQAKLAFEDALKSSGLNYSIVRPTAFFKSLSGQADRLRRGKPYLMFGDGALTACKPISDDDLGRFIALCVTDLSKCNSVLPIGGPGPALTPVEQGALLADAFKKPFKAHRVPPAFLSSIIALAAFLGRFSQTWRDRAEFARIGHYYATESMLVWNDKVGAYDAETTPEFGADRLEDHYRRIARGELKPDLGAHAVF